MSKNAIVLQIVIVKKGRNEYARLFFFSLRFYLIETLAMLSGFSIKNGDFLFNLSHIFFQTLDLAFSISFYHRAALAEF